MPHLWGEQPGIIEDRFVGESQVPAIVRHLDAREPSHALVK